MTKLGEKSAPPGFVRVDYRRDPCDSQMGFPPARADRQSHVYQNLKQGLILKIRLKREMEVFEREIALLQIAGKAGLPVPEVRSRPVIKNGWASYTASYIEHRPTDKAEAGATAQVIAKLHALKVDKSLPPALHRGNLPENARIVLKHSRCDKELEAAIESRCLPLVKEIIADMQEHSSLLHGDLHLGNLLPSRPLPSLVDFEHGGRGSPVYDMARVRHSQLRYRLNERWSENFIKEWQLLCDHPLDKLDKYLEYYDWVDTLNLWLWVQKAL